MNTQLVLQSRENEMVHSFADKEKRPYCVLMFYRNAGQSSPFVLWRKDTDASPHGYKKQANPSENAITI